MKSVFFMDAHNERGRYPLRVLSWTSGRDAAEILRGIDVDPYGIEAMLPKMANVNIHIQGLPCKVANVIKQEMLAIGGDAAVARGSVSCSVEKTDLVLIGTRKQIGRFTEKIAFQPFGMAALADSLRALLENLSAERWEIPTGRRVMMLGDRTLVMGILNVTPDSFSDGGRFASPEDAVECGLQMVADGADILDIGGESSRPGAVPVTQDEELRRTIPVIQGLHGKINAPMSIDTTKAAVAREAVAAGAEIINDISAMRFDDKMLNVMAQSGAALVFMHMRGVPRSMQKGDLRYSSLQGEIVEFFRERLSAAQVAGIPTEKVIIDPGIGFGKTGSDSLKLLRHLSDFKSLGRPILAGPSRKSFLGHQKDQSAAELKTRTAAAVTAAIMNGCQIVRVHDVREMKGVAAVADAIARV
ncbi:MAG: Dihydropteroate synthase [Syntrophaceae bacterium PtaB.Bin095]|nr:MAG: Dihydropteroate synthase [Syntrophaceae bacterium PtaB.Bin095]